jgi:hypothetical protein
MPQLDIDLLDDFIYFAFIALIFGFGDSESEENVVSMGADLHLAQYYMLNYKTLIVNRTSIETMFNELI